MSIRVAAIGLIVFAMPGAVRPAAAADAPDPSVRRVVVQFAKGQACASGVTYFGELQNQFYADQKKAVDAAGAVLSSCLDTSALVEGDVYVVTFLAKATLAADKFSVQHLLLRRAGTSFKLQSDFLGKQRVHWVYLTGDDCDKPPVVELLVAKTENPVSAQLGALAKTLLPIIPVKVKQPGLEARAPTCSIGALVVFRGTADLPYKRATISESYYVQRVLRNDQGLFLKPKGDETANGIGEAGWTEVDGTATFSSTPLTTMMFHAGAGALVGRVVGARQMGIDSGKFISDPVGRAVTVAGVSWHRPFDGTAPTASKSEQWGFFTGGVLTPSPGVAAGATYGWRGVGLMVGWAEMWVKTAPRGLTEGAAVPDGAVLALRPAGGVLVGATYGFGGS